MNIAGECGGRLGRVGREKRLGRRGGEQFLCLDGCIGAGRAMLAWGVAAVSELAEPRLAGGVRKFCRRNGKEQALGDGEAVLVGAGEQGDLEGHRTFWRLLEDQKDGGVSMKMAGCAGAFLMFRTFGILELYAVFMESDAFAGNGDVERHALRAGLVRIGVVARFREEPQHGHGGIFIHGRRELPSVHGGKFRPLSMEAVGQGLCRRRRACAKEGEGKEYEKIYG